MEGIRSWPRKNHGCLLRKNLCFCTSPARICKMGTECQNLCCCNGHSSTDFNVILHIYVSKKFGSGWILPAGALDTESSVDSKTMHRDWGYWKGWFANHRCVTQLKDRTATWSAIINQMQGTPNRLSQYKCMVCNTSAHTDLQTLLTLQYSLAALKPNRKVLSILHA